MERRIVITTRPVDDAVQDIADLEHRGITALAAPMLGINPLTSAAKPEHDVDAVVLTSRHAPQLVAKDLHDLPCYCVGASTASAASQAGFSHVITGPGEGQGLVTVMREDGLNHVFWPSAVDTGFNIADALAAHSITVTRQPVYKAATVHDWPADVDHAIRQGHVTAILMHSGRAGEHFAKMMAQHGLDDARKTITAIVISARAAGLCGDGWHNIIIAATPRRSAMFVAAAEVLGLPQSCFDDDDLDQDL